MTIKERVRADLSAAMKAQEKLRLGAVRLIQAAIKKKEIDTMKELDDAGIIPILQTMVKQRKESIEQFEKGGRQDLVDKEKSEILVIESYLPQQLATEELSSLIAQAIQETGATSARDMGAVIKVVMAKAAGRAEGAVISRMVKEKLTG